MSQGPLPKFHQGDPGEQPATSCGWGEPLKTLLRYTFGPCQVLDNKRRLLDVNQAWLDLLGYQRDEIVGKWFGDILLSKQLPRFELSLARLDNVDDVRGMVFDVRCCHGAIVSVELDLRLIPKCGDHENVIYCSLRDVSARKQAEYLLRESEQRYRMLFTMSPDAIVLIDLEGVVLDLNQAAVDLTQLDRTQVVGNPFAELPIIDEENSPQYLNWFGGLVNGDTLDKLVIAVNAQGETRWMENHASLLYRQGEPFAVLVIARDITKRARADEQLAVQRDLGVAMVEAEKFGDAMGRLLEIACGVECVECGAVYLVEPEGALSLVAHHQLSPAYSDASGRLLADSRQSKLAALGKPSYQAHGDLVLEPREEAEHLRANALVPIRYGDQTIALLDLYSRSRDQISSTARKTLEAIAEQMGNIIVRLQAKEALQESEQRYRLLAQNISDVIWIRDLDLRYTYISPSVTRMQGISVAKAMQQSLQDILTPESLDVAQQVFSEELALTTPRSATPPTRTLELEFYHADGGTFWTETTTTTLRATGGMAYGFLGVTRDITARKRAEQDKLKLEEQLIQSQKMEAIGRLAGGVAHDFNNLLTTINGISEVLLTELNAKDPVREDLIEINKAGARAAALTGQLLAFSRKQVLQPVPLFLNSVVSDLDRMLRRLIGEDIELVLLLEPELHQVEVDLAQIQQVVVNLVVNARDAMPAGGKLTIKTENLVLSQAEGVKPVDVPDGHYVLLTVEDDGEGMDEVTQARLFEPFFTTKEQGKGTGLGLSTVYGIVTQSGGFILAESEQQQGTTFQIYLPCLEHVVQLSSSSNVEWGWPRGHETVLVVEDEPNVRRIIVRVLKRQGYQVLVAPNGEEALRQVRENPMERIQLLLTDVVMPLMGGRELATRMQELYPDIRVLYTSGYTEDTVALCEEQGGDFLQKPFSPEGLSWRVREVLDTQ